MNILYGGKYRKRFDFVTKQLKGKSVLELCFGDVIIANHCRQSAIDWVGIDINNSFVKNANKKGFNATLQDLNIVEKLPKAETCVMIGSLYHFAANISDILRKMLRSAPIIIISEPVKNLSSQKGILGFFARRSAKVNKQTHNFRFDEKSFVEMLEKMSKILNFSFYIADRFNKDIIVVISR